MSAPYASWAVGVGDGSDDEDMEEDYRYTKQANIWAIEATDDMLAPTLADAPLPPPTATAASGRPPATQGPSAVPWKGAPARSKMEECLRAAYATMKRKVISSPKDLVGIIDETSGPGEGHFENCRVILPLAQVDAHNIRKMKELLQKAEEDPYYLSNLLVPNKGKSVVVDIFGHCSSTFRERSPSANNSIFLVTDNDDPIEGYDQLFEVARTKRSDLHEAGFSIEPFLIPPTDDGEFDVDKFWGPIITAVDEDDSDVVSWPTVNRNLRGALASMITAMRHKEAAKRVAFKIPFVLGKDFVIGIAGFNVIGEESKKPPTKVDLNTEAGEEVISKTKYIDAESGAELNPKTEIKKYFAVGQSDFSRGIQAAKIFFGEDDIRKVKTMGRPPSLKLLGFKPREGHLRFQDSVKHSYFIYPDEDRYTGSTRTFTALLNSMLKKDVIGLGSFIPRTTGKPQVVLLIPQDEELNSAGVPIDPAGMHICQLPYADDIRDLGIEQTVTIMNLKDPEDSDDDEPEQPAVDIVKKFVKSYSKKYIPDDHPNPSLNYFYETLAALALDEELPEPDDKSLPKYEIIDHRIGQYIADLKKLIPEDDIDPSRMQTSKSKRPVKKEADDGPPPDLSDFLAVWEEKGTKMTIPQLKEGLKLMRLPVSGKKDDLLDRVEGYLADHGLVEKREPMDVDSEEEEKPKPKKKRRVVVDDESD
ncbi:hypothetical protein JCM10213_008165 [Rhodosporidiobolus nylandii]